MRYNQQVSQRAALLGASPARQAGPARPQTQH